MYICDDCGHIFEEPITWEERHGFTHGPFERWYGCPHCKGSYEEAKRCDNCGEYISKDESSDLCRACQDDVVDRFNRFIRDEFNEAEREFLLEHVEETIIS